MIAYERIGEWAVTCIPRTPGPCLPGWRRESLSAWVILVLHPQHLISETNQNCTPHHQHLGPRQGQISLATGRRQIHLRQALVFKNMLSSVNEKGVPSSFMVNYKASQPFPLMFPPHLYRPLFVVSRLGRWGGKGK